jgi:PTH1 family peptidyl-tRNA hydrolase
VWLVVGLGNPGKEYEHTRHNIGFMVEGRSWPVAGREASNGAKFGGEIAQARGIVMLRPQEYANVSGRAVQRTQAFCKVELNQTIVVHDEIDLPFRQDSRESRRRTRWSQWLRSIIQD